MDNKKDNFFLPQKKDKHNILNIKQQQKQQRQDDFDQNRKGVSEKTEQMTKKPFDKKTYRLKKYSKKYKLEQWEEQRKKRLIHKYQKELKNDPVFGSYKPKSFDNDTIDTTPSNVGQFVRHPDLIAEQIQSEDTIDNETKTKKIPINKAMEQLTKVKQSKLEKQQEIQRAKEERSKKLQEYNRKKQERFKKLSKKTKKGQPVMTGRLEMLLDKLQKSK